MIRSLFRTALGAVLVLGAAPAFSDEPGPGGTKVPKPLTGEQVYRTVCASCHMADAKGAAGAGAIPALAANAKFADAAYPIYTVVNGKGAMPWLRDTLDARQIAGVVGYVRTHFGNNYPAPVTEAEVREIMGPDKPAER